MRRQPNGGAGDEAGGEYRRAVAALFVAYGLNGLSFPDLPFGGADAAIETVALESDDPIDDVVVGFTANRLFIQAKRTLRFGRPFREVAAQWLRAVRDPDFDETRDFIAAASGALPGAVGPLARALPRLRAGKQDLKQEEDDAVSKLRAACRDLGATDAEIDKMLSRAVIFKLEVEEAGQTDAARGALLLDSHVVAKGRGHDAWSALIAIAGHAARWRIGHTIEGWLDELRQRGLPLTADAEASRAAHLEAQHQALYRYRSRLIERGRFVDLTVLGAAVPKIALADIDAVITVANTKARDQSRLDLLWAFRRRGRVTLTGLPGGGKSVAMAQLAAEWAEHDDWTTPILVSLRPLAERTSFRARPLRERLLDLAVAREDAADRVLVRDALDQALRNGDAVLFLDGLDEAADRSLPLTQQIAELLDDVHEDTDVLLATRDVAYAAAHNLLHFADLRLNPPEHASRAVNSVLAAIAAAREINNPSVWTSRREEWVERVLRADSQITETPLLPVLLALVAADSDSGELPETRAEILARVVRDIVRRYEIHRDIALRALPEGHEADALLGAYPVIAATLTALGGTATRDALIHDVAAYLQATWDLAPGPAHVTARQILVVWDESGIFVARGQQQLTSPRLQLFLEIGTALDAAARPEAAADFVATVAAEPERRETLILAAGLSPQIANAFADRAAIEPDEALALAAAAAVRQGARVADQQLRGLVVRLIDALSRGDDAAWAAAEGLVELPVPPELQDEVLAALEIFPAAHRDVAQALAALSWNWQGERRAAALETGLRVPDLPRLERRVPRRERSLTLLDVTVDQGFMRVKERAAAELLPRRPDLAPIVADGIRNASIPTGEALAAALFDHGYGDLAAATFKELYSGTSSDRLRQISEDIEHRVEDALAAIASLAEPAALTRAQTRRLAELGSFLDTVDFNHSGRWPRKSRLAEMRTPWYRLIATLAGFNLGVLAAEARVVQSEVTNDDHAPFFSLFGAHPSAQPIHWERVDDASAGARLAVGMLGVHWATAAVAAAALVAHPDRDGAAAQIAAVLEDIRYDSKRAGVYAYLSLVRDEQRAAAELAQSPDEGVRAALASVFCLLSEGRPTAIGVSLALDEGRRVQLAALEQFKAELKTADQPTAELVMLVERIAAQVPRPFTCYRCGINNNAERDSCHSCNIITQDPAEEARQILESTRAHV